MKIDPPKLNIVPTFLEEEVQKVKINTNLFLIKSFNWRMTGVFLLGFVWAFVMIGIYTTYLTLRMCLKK